MGRTSKAVTSGLLICALAAVTVPAGLHLAPAFLPKDPAAVAVLPAAQLAPTGLGTVSGISALSNEAPLPDAAKLSAALKNALKFDGEGTFSMYVADASSGAELFSQSGQASRTPASNLKLLTAAAALEALGPEARFSTKAVAGKAANEIVLVAGGDTMLAAGAGSPESAMGHAGMADLARDTAQALAVAGVKGPVTLGLDDTLFSGPALNPSWARGDVAVGEIAPIYPVALNAARLEPEVLGGPRPQDPAMAAMLAFDSALQAAGVSTTGNITRTTAPEALDGTQAGPGTVRAEVQSATVARQVQYMLAESDNYVAEALARMVAVKRGHAATNKGSVAAVRQEVERLGLPLAGVVMNDNCGLAEGNLISAEDLTAVVSLMLADPASAIGQALPGLPIAGLTGSLSGRFAESPQLAGAGLVRAKTGSLNEVTALTGYVINSRGRLLAFSILGNGLTGGAAAARPVVDAAAAVLAQG